MKNQDSKSFFERFEQIIACARSMFDLSMEELKQKYADYPICTMKYIEERIEEDSIEVRFDHEKIVFLCLLKSDDTCSLVCLFFDSLDDEERFIGYLIAMQDYLFRKSCWKIGNYYLKVEEARNTIFFYLYK